MRENSVAVKGGAVLALDIGEKRIGVARASLIARLAEPLATLNVGNNPIQQIEELIEQEGAELVVVGLPRSLSGQDTEQTRRTKVFIERLKTKLTIPVEVVDEALTSVEAERELKTRGRYVKADIDALAASYILENYLTTMEQQS